MFSFKLGFIAILAICVIAALINGKPEKTEPPVAVQTPINLPEDQDLPTNQWREMFFEDAEPLLNYPAISVLSRRGDDCRVKATNQGKTTLQYDGYNANRVSIFQEIWIDDKWNCSDWSWCGTGIETHELRPGHSVVLTFSFRDPKRRERIFVDVVEKGTNRASLVVLATEPKQ